MKAIVRDEGAKTACRQLARLSVDYLLEQRRSLAIRPRRRRQFVWDYWCDLMVAGAAWLLLFGLALAALSTVARPHSAESPLELRGAEIVPAGMTEPSSSRAGGQMLP